MEAEQLDAEGRLRHLITLEGLPKSLLLDLMDRARAFISKPGQIPAFPRYLAGRTVANLFFEPSTRTRVSFELAAKRLGAVVVNVNVAASSAAKGESLLDTLYTLEAMNVDIVVVRHAQAGTAMTLATHAGAPLSVLSAGEGHTNHPTQGLLDALTISLHKKAFPDLGIAIVGDIRHSRVARSAWHALSTLGVTDFRWAGPRELLPPASEGFPGRCTEDMDAAVADADVVMMLRIQKERMAPGLVPDDETYFARYGLTPTRLALARPDAIVMHPGPMNRGVEIDPLIADGSQSVIRQQVCTGVAVRMAVMSMVMEARHGTLRTQTV